MSLCKDLVDFLYKIFTFAIGSQGCHQFPAARSFPFAYTSGEIEHDDRLVFANDGIFQIVRIKRVNIE